MGDSYILHLDCPTKEEIRKRVTEVLNEMIAGDGLDEDCPLCHMMKQESYNIVYYCQVLCHECKKSKICKNFNPNSREEICNEDQALG